MLPIVIYAVAALAVVVIGLVAVGRETFIAAHEMRPAVYEVTEAVEFVADGLDDRTASRLTPDDVRWILQVDADLFESTGESADGSVEVGVLDDASSVEAVMARLDKAHRAVIDERDVVAVLAGRSRYLEAIGAIGAPADDENIDGGSSTEVDDAVAGP